MAFLFLMLSLFISCSQKKSEWKGRIEVVDGVTIVKNPKEPLYGPDVFNLKEDLSIGEAEGREKYMFFQIHTMAVSNNGDIYVLDIRENFVKVFNRYGEYIKTIGKKGEGPGEFIRPRNVVCFSQDKLAVGGMLRISCYSLNGEFLYRINPTKLGLIQFNIDSLGNIISWHMDLRHDITQFKLKKFSPELNEIFVYTTAQRPRSDRNEFNPFIPILTWTLSKDDRVICGFPADEYKLEMYDKEGRLEKEIHREYSSEPVSESDKGAILKFLKMDPERKLSVPSVKLPFRRIYSDDEGRIFVQTWRILENGEGFYYDIFDTDGKYLCMVPLKFVPLVIKKGKLYTIEEDKEGYQYVKRYKVTWNN